MDKAQARTRGGDADGPRKPPKAKDEDRRREAAAGRARRQLPGLRPARNHPADQARATPAEEAAARLTSARPPPI